MLAEILLAARKRLAIQLALGYPGDARGGLRGLARRKRLQQDVENAIRVQGLRRFACRDDDDELPLLAMRLLQPAFGLAKREAGDFLELLGKFACQGDLARRAEFLRQVGQGAGDAMRRLEQDDRQGTIERFDRPAPRAAGSGQEAGEAIAGLTRRPARCASATSRAPGSAMPGVPASLTRATLLPSRSAAIRPFATARSLCSCNATVRAAMP
jgi:hypothetical protein